MKTTFISLLILMPLWGTAQSMLQERPVQSMKYSWKKPAEKKDKNLFSTVLFQGQGHDMEFVQVSACEVRRSGKKYFLQVPGDEEHLIILKSGHLDVSFKDSAWTLTPGSVALLMPGEKFTIRSAATDPARYYLMKYRSKSPPAFERGQSSGGSFVKEWERLTFRKHDRGGVRPYFNIATVMCKRFEMHVTTLNAGVKSHDPHSHGAEEIILMLEDTEGMEGRTEMQIGDRFFKGEAGDLYYVGSNLLHGIRNDSDTPCSYFAFQFE